jgi:hypothetical protein
MARPLDAESLLRETTIAASPSPTRPDKIAWPLGRDRYGRQLSLTANLRSNGTYEFALLREPKDQRDDAVAIHDIPLEAIVMLSGIAEVVRAIDKMGAA